MNIVVPLAGPDFEMPDGSVRAEISVSGQVILRKALEGRPWWVRGQSRDRDLVFVLRDSAPSRRFAREQLARWYPAARIVLLSATTRGAALSALAGVALACDNATPLCIDLVDIIYTSTLDPFSIFGKSRAIGGIALTFQSENPVYSYLRTDTANRVVEAAEKRVISNHASAGTYFFDSPATYLDGLAHSLRHPDSVCHNELFFVCPVFNGVIASGKQVVLEVVHDAHDIKVVPDRPKQ